MVPGTEWCGEREGEPQGKKGAWHQPKAKKMTVTAKGYSEK